MKIIRYFFLLMTMLCLSGCSILQKQTFETRFEKKYLDMQSYAASGCITVYSNKTENTYKFAVGTEKDGARFISYPDDKMKIVFTNGEAHILNGASDGKKIVKTEREEYLHIFPDEFFKKYIAAQNEEYQYKKEGNLIAFKCDLTTKSGDNLTEIMTVDEKKLEPKSFIVYRKGGEKLIEIKFDEFEFVKSFKKEAFNIDL